MTFLAGKGGDSTNIIYYLYLDTEGDRGGERLRQRKMLEPGKACGPDCIRTEMLKHIKGPASHGLIPQIRKS